MDVASVHPILGSWGWVRYQGREVKRFQISRSVQDESLLPMARRVAVEVDIDRLRI